MKISKLALVLIFSLASCTPSDEKIQQKIAETKMSQSTITLNSIFQATTDVTSTEEIISTITPSLTPSPLATQLSTPTPEIIVEESTDVSKNELYFPDALAIKFIDFIDIDLKKNDKVLLSLPCRIMSIYSEDSQMACNWPGQVYFYFVDLNDLQGGDESFLEEDVIMLIGTYEGLTTNLEINEFEQEKLHTIIGVYVETDMTAFAYEPATTDLTSSFEEWDSYEGDNIQEAIPTEMILFPYEFRGLYVKLPCVISEVMDDNNIFCIWKDAEEEYLVFTDNSSFAGLQSADKLTIYGFVNNTYSCYSNSVNERICVQSLLLSSYEKH